MSSLRFAAIPLCFALAIGAVAAVPVEARRDRHHDNWHDRWENRRDARRAGIVAGLVAGGIARSAAEQRVERRYEECVYATGYDYECERARYWDEQRARRGARRTAIIVGVTTREVVRD